MTIEKSKATDPSEQKATKQDESAATTATLQPESNKNQQTESEKSIRLVVQRFRRASLLVDESKMVTVGGDNADESTFSGILVYASFAKSATKEKVLQAAKTIMNLPILTRGLWGDGTEPVSVLEMAKGGSGVAVLLVPQANLISKVRSQGRSIQYHGQIDKAAGEALYAYLVDCIRAIALEHQFSTRGDALPKWLTDFGKPTKVDASVPPDQVFRDVSLYSSWDELGIPQTDQNGEPLSKSALKKLKKQYDAHKKRHEKYLKTASTAPTTETSSALSWELLDDSFIHVVVGSFGKRQGLEMESDMGPFCHVLNL